MTEKEIRVGKHPDNDLILSGKYVADYHARFSITSQQATVEDLQSTFGTHVNGKPIQKATVLKPNDRVKVGTQLVDWKSFLMDEIEEDKDAPLYWQDLFRPTGSISWATYKYILLLAIAAVCVIPIGIPTLLTYLEARSTLDIDLATPENIAAGWWISSSIAVYIFLNLTQKMIRTVLKK